MVSQSHFISDFVFALITSKDNSFMFRGFMAAQSRFSAGFEFTLITSVHDSLVFCSHMFIQIALLTCLVMAIFTGVPQVLVYTSIVIFYQNKLTCFIFTEIANIPFLLSFTLTFHMDPFVNPQTIDCMKCTITLVTLISAFLVVYQFMSPHTAGGEKHTVTLAAFNFSFSFVMCLAVLIDSKWIIACKVTIVAFV